MAKKIERSFFFSYGIQERTNQAKTLELIALIHTS